MKLKKWQLATILLALMVTGCGMTAPRSHIGFADLDALSWRDVDTTMTLSLGPIALGFAAMMVHDDPEIQLLLDSMKGVRVKTYQIEGVSAQVAEDLNRMSTKLQSTGWEPIVLVREAQEATHILIKMDGDKIAGMTVLTSDSAEVVLVNIMGEIRLGQFAGFCGKACSLPDLRVKRHVSTFSII